MTTTNHTLDSRIAEALTTEHTSREVLFGLWEEAFASIKSAEQTVATESARALDIENPDPTEADAAVRKAQLNISRLSQRSRV